MFYREFFAAAARPARRGRRRAARPGCRWPAPTSRRRCASRASSPSRRSCTWSASAARCTTTSRSMRIPVRRGRAVHRRRRRSAAPAAAVVNETLAARLFGTGGSDRPAARARHRPDDPWLTIVGVVADVRHGSLERPAPPELYTNYLGSPPFAPYVVVRTAGDPAAMATSVRQFARTIDPGVTALRRADHGERPAAPRWPSGDSRCAGRRLRRRRAAPGRHGRLRRDDAGGRRADRRTGPAPRAGRRARRTWPGWSSAMPLRVTALGVRRRAGRRRGVARLMALAAVRGGARSIP